MKQTGRFVRTCAVGVATIAFLVASSARAEMGKAVVRAVRGTATYSEGGGWDPLRVGKILKPGAKIRTEAQSQVDLFLDQNGPVVRVTESTTLGLDKMNFEATGADTVIETQLDLSSGRILGSVKKMAAASKYEVKTPVGIAGIRGTDYDISANGRVRVLQGSVVTVFSQGGQTMTQVVNTGEQFNPASTTQTKIEPIPPQVLVELKNDVGRLNRDAGTPGPQANVTQPTQTSTDSGKVNAEPQNPTTDATIKPYRPTNPLGEGTTG